MGFRLHKQYRLKDYDYSSGGFYFVTICTQYWKFDFGIIIDGKMKLTRIGEIAKQYWFKIPEHFENIKLDKFVVMPNHVHGIIVIGNFNNCRNVVGCDCRNAPWRVPTKSKTKFGSLKPKSLSLIINQYKGSVRRWCNKNNANYFRWQSRFHDRIIRNNKELNKIRNYIINNPAKWETDRNNPNCF